MREAVSGASLRIGRDTPDTEPPEDGGLGLHDPAKRGQPHALGTVRKWASRRTAIQPRLGHHEKRPAVAPASWTALCPTPGSRVTVSARRASPKPRPET